MNIGEFNELIVARQVDFGYYLENEEGDEVLLPTRYVPEDIELDGKLEVFVYLDSEDRLIATTDKPKLVLGEIAPLEVVQVNKGGAFVDMGLMKDLLVPGSEQYAEMHEGRKYLVKMLHDERSDRLYGTTNLHKLYTDTPDEIEVGQKFEAVLWRKSPLGYMFLVNGSFIALMLNKDAHQSFYPGDETEVHVKKINEHGQVLLSMFKQGYKAIDDFSEIVLRELELNDGELELNDTSSPEEIKLILGMSKKAFKKAIGRLLKEERISITEDGIELKKGSE